MSKKKNYIEDDNINEDQNTTNSSIQVDVPIQRQVTVKKLNTQSTKKKKKLSAAVLCSNPLLNRFL